IPFLVIEPAKAEYRNMLHADGLKDLQIFAPGYKDIAPFHINPFEFPTGIDPQAHISNLYTVFNAAFILYAPMPYVLERALYEVYEDRGWDLGAGLHPDYDYSKKCVPSLAFPTLTDLYFKIGEVVDRLGYDQRIRMDVTAGLQARVDSLRVGQKGRTFDIRRSVPFDSLLEKPTILEVSHIGSDDEKAFLIGLVLMRLYEERELGGESANLKHVTVIEEAHRLLTKTSTDTSSAEEANMKGKSVETFCNILSEIRAYGEGIMVAEQIPAKLAQDVLKNTNLKIMHRVVAGDDRELMGMMMNLSETQQFAVTSLKRGEAATFAEGLETPALVKVPLVKIAKKASDADVKKASDEYYSRFPLVNQQSAGCKYCMDICRFGARAKRLIGNSAKMAIWGQALASLGTMSPELTDWHALSNSILPPSVRTNLPLKQKDDMSWCLITIASEIAFWDIRNYKNIDIATIEDLTNSFVHFMSFIRDKKPQKEITIRHADFRQRLLRVMSEKKGPLRGCEVCKNICMFKPLSDLLMKRSDIMSGFNKAISAKKKKEPVREFCEKICAEELRTGQSDIVRGAAICFFAHIGEMVKAKDPAKDIAYIFDIPAPKK
ncbi:MAG: hypothetical protein ABIC40_02295, partial [bacterium]